MGLLFVTFIAGALGSVSRFVVDAEIRRRWLRSGPWPTVVINVTGSLALGALAGWAHISHAGATVDTILGTGFCGGYTTFSTVSFETVRQLQERRYSAAGMTAVACLALSVCAAVVGWHLVA
ncbi:fluoride efflux transporter FluC [Rudaeicoccus suwonensis]|uniref:Fluoride-specific ion channel FluC n=1 Tax=Rudaeicoccus suwonensis TaxID=657409 RepID=A0A561E6P1_9MICO|nr:CrcB family protein [Rudaeicoccus suwonensis]TWE11262.1 camphor resistance protein CrcB [Rudaeicoccus suwonensis]